MYEYLPAIGTMVGGWLFARGWTRNMANRWYLRGNSSDLPIMPFLVFWFLSAHVIYILAGEKMPWLTVHLTLPMILISSCTFGLWIKRVNWVRIGARKVIAVSTTLLVAGLALFDLLKV